MVATSPVTIIKRFNVDDYSLLKTETQITPVNGI